MRVITILTSQKWYEDCEIMYLNAYSKQSVNCKLLLSLLHLILGLCEVLI